MTTRVSDVALRIGCISEISFTHIRCVLEGDRGNVFVSFENFSVVELLNWKRSI
jgi:hypothetical protein